MKDLQEIMSLAHRVDLSTPEKLKAFEVWKLEDGSLDGLRKMLPIPPAMTYEEWSKAFGPIQIEHFQTYVHPDVPEHYLWTIVEVEENRFLMPGRHRVNRVGFAICNTEWTDPEVTIKLKRGSWFADPPKSMAKVGASIMNISLDTSPDGRLALSYNFKHDAAELKIDDMYLATDETLAAVRAYVLICHNKLDFGFVGENTVATISEKAAHKPVAIAARQALERRMIQQGKAFWEVKECYDLSRPDADRETLLIEMLSVLMFKGHKRSGADSTMILFDAYLASKIHDDISTTFRVYNQALTAFRREIVQ